MILGLAKKWATAGSPPPHSPYQWLICRRPPINRFPMLIYYWRLLCRMQGFPLADSTGGSVCHGSELQLLTKRLPIVLFFYFLFFPLTPLHLTHPAQIALHTRWSGAQEASHYRVIPQSRRSVESSWNVGKRSGRKAMLSPPPLGGVATASSRPPRSPDSFSGNSRQDETHPDKPSAPTLRRTRMTICPEYLL